jgi:hypothetical protein
MSWLSDSFLAGWSGHGSYGQGAARPGVAVIRAPPVPGRIPTAPAGDAQACGARPVPATIRREPAGDVTSKRGDFNNRVIVWSRACCFADHSRGRFGVSGARAWAPRSGSVSTALALTSGDDQHRDCDRDRRRIRRRTRRRTDQALSQETSAMDGELGAIDVALIAAAKTGQSASETQAA